MISNEMKAFQTTMEDFGEPTIARMIGGWRDKFECLKKEISALHAEDIKKAYAISNLETAVNLLGEDVEDTEDHVEWLMPDKNGKMGVVDKETLETYFGRKFEALNE